MFRGRLHKVSVLSEELKSWCMAGFCNTMGQLVNRYMMTDTFRFDQNLKSGMNYE